MEEFIDYAKVIMGTLGHKLFEPISKTVSQTADRETEGEITVRHGKS